MPTCVPQVTGAASRRIDSVLDWEVHAALGSHIRDTGDFVP